MNIQIIKYKLLLFAIFLGGLESYSQDFSKNSLFLGFGFIGSSYTSTEADGIGMVVWSFGYQRDIWNNRLRLVPSISLGTYTHKNALDAADAYYNSVHFKLNLNFDIIKIKAFTVLFGTGFHASYSSGLIGTGGYPPGRRSSEYINESNFNYTGLIGFRLAPPKNRIGYELLIIDGSLTGSPITLNFREIAFFKSRFIIKLK